MNYKNFIRYWLIIGASVAFNSIVMIFLKPNFYATMGFDTPLRTWLTIAKLLVGIVIFGFIFPKIDKQKL